MVPAALYRAAGNCLWSQVTWMGRHCRYIVRKGVSFFETDPACLGVDVQWLVKRLSALLF